MATPNDRRIVYGSFVVPQQSYSTTSTEETTEEGSTVGRASYTKYKVDTGVNKYFGGKSTGDHVQITHDQASDEWTAMMDIDQIWNQMDDVWNTSDAVWGSDAGGMAVATSGVTIRGGSVTVLFLYVRNLGSVECQLALEGDEYDILIPADASVAMRVNSISSANIKVKTASGSTTIEYIIAI